MAPFATVEDLERRLGVQYDDTERAQVEALIEDVSALIRQARPSIDADIAAGRVSANVVRMVCCQVVARYMSTVDSGSIGVRSEQHPEYGYTLTTAAANGLELTQSELGLLTPASRRDKAFSIIPR
ncbi:phage Gp19/Gp15/Gp42 family protein [Saccharopolyspora sp. 6T]|uniref:Gp19/Gp15/Gp42 family protein n=1 Tax=Saccharopolyspora sp. 6T TaxID=2877238 RepID=UPI001CD25EC4|nr:Gp19/Gp15/Gp42 family protein [Saccharopolyspora sp. 6T]MCA1185710.1 phage Gp19/Gp15/Gp42 family protein [Saccharopolyspora sp. 6T]